METKKTWLVTGASRGFGLEIAKIVLESGNNVVATVRGAKSELEQLRPLYKNLLIVAMDVTVEKQVNEAIQVGIQRFGKIDVVVNNAGFGLIGAVEDITDHEARSQFDTNVFGVLNVTRAILPQLRKQGSGHIINVSALFAFGTIPGWGIYSATKAAIEAISEGLAQELLPLGIRVTAIEPGMFTTQFLNENSFKTSKKGSDDYKGSVGHVMSLTSSLNGQQPGDPRKLAEALIVLTNSENPPVHLPLGKDCVEFYEKQRALRENEMKAWIDLTYSTDHAISTKQQTT